MTTTEQTETETTPETTPETQIDEELTEAIVARQELMNNAKAMDYDDLISALDKLEIKMPSAKDIDFGNSEKIYSLIPRSIENTKNIYNYKPFQYKKFIDLSKDLHDAYVADYNAIKTNYQAKIEEINEKYEEKLRVRTEQFNSEVSNLDEQTEEYQELLAAYEADKATIESDKETELKSNSTEEDTALKAHNTTYVENSFALCQAIQQYKNDNTPETGIDGNLIVSGTINRRILDDFALKEELEKKADKVELDKKAEKEELEKKANIEHIHSEYSLVGHEHLKGVREINYSYSVKLCYRNYSTDCCSIPFILDVTSQNYYFDGTIQCGGKIAYIKILIVDGEIKFAIHKDLSTGSIYSQTYSNRNRLLFDSNCENRLYIFQYYQSWGPTITMTIKGIGNLPDINLGNYQLRASSYDETNIIAENSRFVSSNYFGFQHEISEVVNLEEELDKKANIEHTHSLAEVVNLEETFYF